MSFLEANVQRNILGLVDEYGTKYPNIQERLDRLLISQYKESENLKQYISDLLCVFVDIMQAAKEVITSDISTPVMEHRWMLLGIS